MQSERITVEVPIEEALNGKTRDEADLDDDVIEDFVAWTKHIERSKAYRELAADRIDEEDIRRATRLLWIDQAEVYSVCDGCFHEKREGQWTGSTQNPDFQKLKRKKQERLKEGRPCTFCKDEKVNDVKADLEDDPDVAVEVVIVE